MAIGATTEVATTEPHPVAEPPATPPATPQRPRRTLLTRLGLRARVTLLFAMGALLLSASMGTLSYLTVRHVLLAERTNASVHQAFANATLVREILPDVSTASLAQLDVGVQSHSLLFKNGQWFSSSVQVEPTAIPATLRTAVEHGTAATQGFVLGNTPELGVGVQLTSGHAAYFEIFDVSDLARTLMVLELVLFGAGVATTILGALVGRAASSRSLRPLTAVSTAAEAIAIGQLQTRLPDAKGDPDLEGLTDAFNLMVHQLGDRIGREARFTSDVSHELRSPLTTLAASLHVLEAHRGELSFPAQKALLLLGADLRRFQRMVSDLLEISRSDSGSADVVMEHVQAGELVRHSVTISARNLAWTTTPPVEIDVESARAYLAVDKRRFERIIANLVENASLYGGGATRILVAPGPPDARGRSTIRILVDDRGPGIPVAERAKVFERFYRGQTSGRRGDGGGTGLGLALVAEHVRLLGGSVWAAENPDGGGRFTVELPVADDDGTW